MSLEQVKDIVVLASAGISVVGIPTLIALIWRFHETQVRALQMFTFKEVEQQIAAMESTYVRVNNRLREYVVELEKRKFEEPLGEIENRLRTLTKARKEISDLPFFLGEVNKENATLYRMYNLHNKRAFELVQSLLDDLIAYEESLKNPIKT